MSPHNSNTPTALDTMPAIAPELSMSPLVFAQSYSLQHDKVESKPLQYRHNVSTSSPKPTYIFSFFFKYKKEYIYIYLPHIDVS